MTATRTLSPDDLDAAAALIAQAYVDDPLCSLMLPFASTRVASLTKFFRAYCAVGVQGQAVHGAGEPLQAVAIWNAPSQPSVSISLKTLGHFLPVLGTFYPLGLLRARPAIAAQAGLRARHAAGPHYYLDNVAVAPAARGQGLASQLIRPVLDLAGQHGALVYADTFTASNVPLYEHLGFRCVEKIVTPGPRLTVWALARPPR